MGFFKFLKKEKQPIPDSELDMPPLPPPAPDLKSGQRLSPPPLDIKPPVFSSHADLNEDFPSFPEFEQLGEPKSQPSVNLNIPLFPRAFPRREPPVAPEVNADKKIDSYEQAEASLAPDEPIELPKEAKTDVSPQEINQTDFFPKKSIFLDVSDFREVIKGIDFSRKNARKLNEFSKEIGASSAKNEARFKAYRNSLVFVEDKLNFLDRKIFG